MVTATLGVLGTPPVTIQRQEDKTLIRLITQANNTNLDIDRRREAILEIGNLRDDTPVEFLITVINDETKNSLHLRAIQALGRIGSKRAIQPLVAIIENIIEKKDHNIEFDYRPMPTDDQTLYLESSEALRNLAKGFKEEILSALSEGLRRFHDFGVTTTLLIGSMAIIDPYRAIENVAIKFSNSERFNPGYIEITLCWIGKLLEKKRVTLDSLNKFLTSIEMYDREKREKIQKILGG